IPVDYQPNAAAPRWAELIARILDNDTGLMGYVQRSLGASLTGADAEQHLYFAHGPGGNGKSTLLNTVRLVLGDYAYAIPVDELLDQGHHNHRTYLERLRGKRLVVTSEPAIGRTLSEAMEKLLTGGEPITANKMRRDPIEFEPTWHLWMSGNHLPRIRGSDNG